MSRLQPFSCARGTLLATIAISGQSSRVWRTGVVAAFACQFGLASPVSASPYDIGQDNAGVCESAIKPVASKSEAILGREMSALEAVQADQRHYAKSACRGVSIVSPKPVSEVSSDIAFTTIGTDADFDNAAEALAITANPTLLVQTLANLSGKQFRERSEPNADVAFAKFTLPSKSKHVIPHKKAPNLTYRRFVSEGISDSTKSPVQMTSKVSRAEPNVKSAFNGKPDIFGSVAMRVSHTPLDRKWSGAQNGREAAIARAALVRAGATIGTNRKVENIRAVNRWINANIKYVEDRKLYGRADHWASAGTTLKSGRGDCEDFAIAKMQLLQASGVKASDMFLVIAKDLVRRVDHSLLVIRVGNEMLVLDNETDLILNAEDVHDYRPIMSYSANGKWLHGYPAKPAGTQMASLAIGR